MEGGHAVNELGEALRDLLIGRDPWHREPATIVDAAFAIAWALDEVAAAITEHVGVMHEIAREIANSEPR